MRIKEAAEASGLTEKAIRLYEEKGLICPNITEINGRKFRDYDEATVALLKTIGGLRRSFFSIEQIAAMQENPDRIPEIFTEYRNELKEQYDRLGMLIGKADEILSQMPETEPVENPDASLEKAVVTPSALRNVETLSEAMTAVTPVVVSEEIPVSAPPKGKREKAELHFRRWDEEIAADEREIVYQRYLEYYSRWEKRYAAELVFWNLFDWIGRHKVVSLVSAVLIIVVSLLAKNGIYLPYEESFDGYMLVMEWEDRINEESPTPVHTEPVSLRLTGEKHYHIIQGISFIGDMQIDGFSPYTFGRGGWVSIPNGTIRFEYYHPRDRHRGHTDSHISGHRGIVDLKNKQGDTIQWFITLPENDTFCVWVQMEDPQYTDADGYMIFPVGSVEEALDWYHTDLQGAWQKEYEYIMSKYPPET